MEENLLAALTGGGTGAFEQRNLATPDPISIDFEPGGDPNTINCENADFVRMVGGEGETRSGVVDQYS